jgi:hypothetical protein
LDCVDNAGNTDACNCDPKQAGCGANGKWNADLICLNGSCTLPCVALGNCPDGGPGGQSAGTPGANPGQTPGGNGPGGQSAGDTAGTAGDTAGRSPHVAGDSYLEVGPIIGSLAITYDWCGFRMTDAQKIRWSNYANQAIYNVWHPSSATWGGRSFPWTGWSIDNPGNNYYYSFLKATMYWALATKDSTLLSFARNQKIQPLLDYFSQIPGGGSLEGTGYGTAHMNMFELYQTWKDSTGEDIANANSHLTDSIKYWLHATTPNRAYYAPIGDLSRSSFPDLFDSLGDCNQPPALLR